MRQYTGSEKERHAGGSFTLIELLVVIAIIAILAAMLMPALKQARDHAKSVKCVANQRNCIYGLSNYADAYQEFFPAALSILHVNGAAKNYGWSGILVSSGFLPLPRVSAVDNIFLGLHGNLWVNQCEIHQNPPSVKQQSGIIAPVGRFYSVCHLTAART